jgi:hypothetical protein
MAASRCQHCRASLPPLLEYAQPLGGTVLGKRLDDIGAVRDIETDFDEIPNHK